MIHDLLCVVFGECSILYVLVYIDCLSLYFVVMLFVVLTFFFVVFFFFNDTATTEIYTSLFVGSVRCV